MRLVTRSDFDGLVCAVLLKDVEKIDEVVFAHPKDMQDGKIEITDQDIITNLPYNPNCGMWFDHHASEGERLDLDANFRGLFEVAPSAARVVYKYYNSPKFKKYDELMVEVDKSDAAQLSKEDVLNPTGWILLSYVMDPRTGLGKYRDYEISNMQLMHNLVDWIRTKTVDEIMAQPDVKARIDRYFDHEKEFELSMKKHSVIERNVILTDLRNVDDAPTGNRFKIYAMYPEANIQVRISYGKDKNTVVCALGHSIFNRTSNTNVGSLMSKFGGGGHRGAGTCQLTGSNVEAQIREIVDACKKDG